MAARKAVLGTTAPLKTVGRSCTFLANIRAIWLCNRRATTEATVPWPAAVGVMRVGHHMYFATAATDYESRERPRRDGCELQLDGPDLRHDFFQMVGVLVWRRRTRRDFL